MESVMNDAEWAEVASALEEVPGLDDISKGRLLALLRPGDLGALRQAKRMGTVVLKSYLLSKLEGQPAPELTYKRVKVHDAPSSLSPTVALARGYLPVRGVSNSNAAFYLGRPSRQALNLSLPVALVSPELALVLDAAYGPGEWPAAPAMVKAALDLCALMAPVYRVERDRQLAFVSWHNEVSSALGSPSIAIPASSSISGANDGQAMAGTSSTAGSFVVALLEVKNELEEAALQLARYVQMAYGQDGSRWARDPVLRYSGCPVLAIMLLGPHLQLVGAYTIEGNVVAMEPLTPLLPLHRLDGRQEQQLQLLVRILTAYWAAARLLDWRYNHLAQLASPAAAANRAVAQGGTALPAAVGGPAAVASPVMPGDAVMRALPESSRQALVTAMRLAVPCPGCGLPDLQPGLLLSMDMGMPSPLSWARLPYPLAPGGRFTGLAEGMPGCGDRLVFRCHLGGRPVLVKLMQGQYAHELHKCWADLDITPRLVETTTLPGRWTMVVQELLGPEWEVFQVLGDASRAAARPLIKDLVQRAHAAAIPGRSSPVHGDLRGANVMVKMDKAGLPVAAMLVDLDWAGWESEGRTYPMLMNMAIAWPAGALPGLPLRQAHDLHMLKHL